MGHRGATAADNGGATGGEGEAWSRAWPPRGAWPAPGGAERDNAEGVQCTGRRGQRVERGRCAESGRCAGLCSHPPPPSESPPLSSGGGGGSIASVIHCGEITQPASASSPALPSSPPTPEPPPQLVKPSTPPDGAAECLPGCSSRKPLQAERSPSPGCSSRKPLRAERSPSPGCCSRKPLSAERSSPLFGGRQQLQAERIPCRGQQLQAVRPASPRLAFAAIRAGRPTQRPGRPQQPSKCGASGWPQGRSSSPSLHSPHTFPPWGCGAHGPHRRHHPAPAAVPTAAAATPAATTAPATQWSHSCLALGAWWCR